MILEDTTGNGQTEPGSLLLGAHEGLKDDFAQVFGDAGAGILHADDHDMPQRGKASHFFDNADIAAGTQSEKYVGYAYSKGYTNGYSATTFRPSQTVTASQYMEFILRALGYSSADNKDLSGTLSNALANGVITEGELSALQSGTFLRADLAYVSYYALDAVVAGSSQTLEDVLLDKGVFTAREAAEAAALVTSSRK